MIRWLAAFLLLATPAGAADLTILSAGAINSVATQIAPSFEATTGNHLTLQNDTVGGLVRRITAGETFDVVMMSPAGLEELAKAGKIAAGTGIPLAKVGVGVGIKTGASAPDLSTVAAFKAAMLNARAVAYIDPASGGSSGIYLAKLFQTLGIADAMAPKSVLVKGGLAAKILLDGHADLAVQQISEIISVPGVTLAGPLPAEIQLQTVDAGAVATQSAAPEAATAFLAAMAGPAAKPVLEEKGMTAP